MNKLILLLACLGGMAMARADELPVHQLKSLSSDEFSDLQFLKPLLAGKRVVQLGESGHGVAEFDLVKVRLIKFLHQQLGYDVVAFESSLPQCYAADQSLATATAADSMRACIFPQWRMAEVLPLFDYLRVVRQSGQRLTLAGFDVQPSSASERGGTRLRAMLGALGSPLRAGIDANEAMLDLGIRNSASIAENAERLERFYGNTATALTDGAVALSSAGFAREDVAVALKSAQSRVHLTRQFASAGSNRTASAEARDIGMAENIDFLLDTLYPGRKVIVWAHNAHIAYTRPAGMYRSMGMQLAERRKSEIYSIGLYMGRGEAANNDNSHYPVAAPPAASMESVLARETSSYVFVDFSRAKTTPATIWMFAPIVAREWGRLPTMIVPAATFDAVLYIDTVTPPGKL
ncbi:MAG: erythromycin esterase family protein [Pseudomonadota bacterium]